jgi:iron-sulfur cluster assembly accessory protein
MTQSVIVTERAAVRIKQIVAAEAQAKMLRISVEGGGCSGFSYKFDLVQQAEADDIVIEARASKSKTRMRQHPAAAARVFHFSQLRCGFGALKRVAKDRPPAHRDGKQADREQRGDFRHALEPQEIVQRGHARAGKR